MNMRNTATGARWLVFFTAYAVLLLLSTGLSRRWARMQKSSEVRGHLAIHLKCNIGPNRCAALCIRDTCVVQTMYLTAIRRQQGWKVVTFGRLHTALGICATFMAATGHLWHIFPVLGSLVEVSAPGAASFSPLVSDHEASAILISNPMEKVTYKSQLNMKAYYHKRIFGTSPYISKIRTLREGVEKLNISILHDRDMACMLSPQFLDDVRRKSVERGTGGFYMASASKQHHYPALVAKNCTIVRLSSFIVYDSFKRNRISDLAFADNWLSIMMAARREDNPWWFDSQLSNYHPEVAPYLTGMKNPSCTHCPTPSIDRWSCLSHTAGVYTISVRSAVFRTVLGILVEKLLSWVAFRSHKRSTGIVYAGYPSTHARQGCGYMFIPGFIFCFLAFIPFSPGTSGAAVAKAMHGMKVTVSEATFKFREISVSLLVLGYFLSSLYSCRSCKVQSGCGVPFC